MAAGELDQRVTVQSRSVTTGVSGDRQQAFTDVNTFWCKVTPLRAAERGGGDISVYTDAYRFRFRRNSVTKIITPANRLKWNTVLYDVKQGPNLADKVWSEVVAEQAKPSARDA